MRPKLNSLRIIGGRFRGRKISFPDLPELRPTPDRVRETLFNWLQSVIYHSVCLDLFCGSGALSLEAISRGAASVIAFDKEPKVIANLNKITKELQLSNFKIYQQQFPFNLPLQQLSLTPHSINIIFLDPPFHQDFAIPCLNWIAQNEILKQDGLVYLETEADYQFSLLPQWELLKEKTAGAVCYRLLKLVPK